MSPASQTKLQQKARGLIARSTGDIYLLQKGESPVAYRGVLSEYQLTIREERRLRVGTRFNDDLYLVPLARAGERRDPWREGVPWQPGAPLGTRHASPGVPL